MQSTRRLRLMLAPLIYSVLGPKKVPQQSFYDVYFLLALICRRHFNCSLQQGAFPILQNWHFSYIYIIDKY